MATTPMTPRSRRTSIREHLGKKRASLAPHEFSFVTEMLDAGDDDHLESIERVLLDEDLFFDDDDDDDEKEEEEEKDGDPCEATAEETEEEAGDANEEHENNKSNYDDDGLAPPTPALFAGSTRRASRMEKRRSCSTSVELWKRSSLKLMTSNRLSAAERNPKTTTTTTTRKPRPSTFLPICEDNVFEHQEGDETGDDESDGWLEEKEDAEEEKSEKEQKQLDLLTRRASQNLYHGEGFEIGAEELFSMYSVPQYDPWDEETDREGHAFDFNILGTSHHDCDAQPHVLSPPIMHALQSSLPVSKRGESFWLKYSLVRDGDSTTRFLRTLRGSPYTLMAMETVDGEVFGAFTSAAWTVQPSFFGGGEAFVWRMKHSRLEVASSVMEQAQQETDLEIFPYAFENPFAQVCQTDRVAVGGGTPSSPREVKGGAVVHPGDFGAALAFEGNSMMEATSAPCLTFRSPSLSTLHRDGSRFELINLEVWSFTPCITLAEAQRLECQHLFLKRNSK